TATSSTTASSVGCGATRRSNCGASGGSTRTFGRVRSVGARCRWARTGRERGPAADQRRSRRDPRGDEGLGRRKEPAGICWFQARRRQVLALPTRGGARVDRGAGSVLQATGAGGMIGPCLIGPGSSRATCKDARGLRAGGPIAVLGGLRAEGRNDGG